MARRRPTFLVGGLAAAAIFAAAMATAAILGRDTTTAVPIGDVVERFRAGGTTESDTVAFPPVGVYVYATTGHDEVDALGGTRHDYPDETTLTVTSAACGLRVRWDALAERWWEHTTCLTDVGEEYRTVVNYHQFFGRGDLHTYRCEIGSLARPVPAEAGQRWENRCAAEDSSYAETGEVIGFESLRIGDHEVKTVHLRLRTVHRGETTGTKLIDDWLLVDTGLLVRRVGATDTSTSSAIGAVRHVEEVELHLVDLEPQR